MRFFVFICFLFSSFVTSCVTSTELYNHGAGTTNIRNEISEGQGLQAESANAGARIEKGIDNAEISVSRIESRINELESVVASGETNDSEILDIFDRVRTRTTANTESTPGERQSDLPP